MFDHTLVAIFIHVNFVGLLRIFLGGFLGQAIPVIGLAQNGPISYGLGVMAKKSSFLGKNNNNG